MKSKLSNYSKNNLDSNSDLDSKQDSRQITLLVSKPKLPKSKTIFEKKNYYIRIKNKTWLRRHQLLEFLNQNLKMLV